MAEPKIAIDILVNCQTGTNALKRFNKELDKTVNGANKVSKATNWLSKGFGRLVGAYFGVQTIKGIVQTGSRLQLLRKSIEGLTKSTQDWEYIKEQAFEKGVDLSVVAKGYRNFFSSARMAGFGKGDIQSMYADVLLSSRAIGASTQQTESALLALEQMLSKGTVSMEELRRQLGNAIPGAFEIGAKAMNMTTQEFNKFVKTGQLASAVFVPKFIAQLKKEYAEGFKDIARTVDYGSAQVKVAWQVLNEEILNGELGRNIAEMLTKFARFLKSSEVRQAIITISQLFNMLTVILGFLIDNLGTILLFIGPALLGGALVKIFEVLKSVVTWVTDLNTSLTLTQKFLFRALFVLLLIQEVMAFFTDKDGLLETAILGKNQSWLDRLGKLVFALLTLGGLFGFGGGASRIIGGAARKANRIAGATRAVGGAVGAVGGATTLAVASGVLATGAAGKMMYNAAHYKHDSSMDACYANMSPITPSAILPTLEKTEVYSPNITYNPQYSIDATTMTPEQLRGMLDERDKSFWSSLVSGTALNKIGVQR